MSFDASGTFTRWGGSTVWQGDATAGTKIMANRHDDHDQELANGLSECLTRSGKGIPTVDIPWGGKKIVNLGTPTQPQDAVTKIYVDTLPGWETSKNISGADLNGRLNFTATSGVNGITWTYADVSWVARHSVASKYGNRLAMNNTVAPNTTGDPVGDVFFIDDAGRINNSGALSSNLSYDGTAWRTISPGTGTLVNYGSGIFAVLSNDTASITNPYVAVTPRQFFETFNSAGSSYLTLTKSASAKTASLRGEMGATGRRWQMDLGDTAAESSTRTGSNFTITSYDNSGVTPVTEMSINRSTHAVSFGGAITSPDKITADTYFAGSDTVTVLSATTGGAVYLRPNGQDTTTGQVLVGTQGNLDVTAPGLVRGGAGYQTRLASNGAFGGNIFNFSWDGTFVKSYIDTQFVGNIAWQCDYRIKRDIQPLGSMWNAVKSLNPIRYRQKAYEIWVDDDTERVGFVAHELQEKLGQGAASGEKDGPEVQSPNMLAIVAALTKALQEAMQRIESLEAAA